MKRLLDDHSTVSLSACDAIHQITGDPTDGVKVGVKLLDHHDWLQRYVGAEHLGLLRVKARSAIPKLRRTTIYDEDKAVRNVAQAALNQIEA